LGNKGTLGRKDGFEKKGEWGTNTTSLASNPSDTFKYYAF
jgi:hypothetical protein